jgi:hypothetical protein
MNPIVPTDQLSFVTNLALNCVAVMRENNEHLEKIQDLCRQINELKVYAVTLQQMASIVRGAVKSDIVLKPTDTLDSVLAEYSAAVEKNVKLREEVNRSLALAGEKYRIARSTNVIPGTAVKALSGSASGAHLGGVIPLPTVVSDSVHAVGTVPTTVSTPVTTSVTAPASVSSLVTPTVTTGPTLSTPVVLTQTTDTVPVVVETSSGVLGVHAAPPKTVYEDIIETPIGAVGTTVTSGSTVVSGGGLTGVVETRL